MARLQPPNAIPERPPVAAELAAAIGRGLPDDWTLVLEPLPTLSRTERLQLTGWALVGPPGILWLDHAFRFRWEHGGWWFAGHEARDVFVSARGAEERLRAEVAPHALDLGGADVVLGHGVLLGPEGLSPEAPGDRFVAFGAPGPPESVAAFVDRLAARGRVGRRLERPPFTRAEVDRLVALVDPRA
jgi:hypothetical protein